MHGSVASRPPNRGEAHFVGRRAEAHFVGRYELGGVVGRYVVVLGCFLGRGPAKLVR